MCVCVFVVCVCVCVCGVCVCVCVCVCGFFAKGTEEIPDSTKEVGVLGCILFV